jgi:plasmid stabilization system protein ParE
VKSLRVHPEARQELRAAARFYEDQVPNLGREFVQEVRVVLERLAEWPASGSPNEDDARRVVLARFPFTVVYQLLPEVIEVHSDHASTATARLLARAHVKRYGQHTTAHNTRFPRRGASRLTRSRHVENRRDVVRHH